MLTVATRGKQRSLNEAAGGEAGMRACERVPDPQTPDDQALVAEFSTRLGARVSTVSALERQVLAHAVVGWSSGETA